MPTKGNVVRGAIVVQNLPELFCFEDARALIEALPTLLGVQIPDSISNVIVSNIQPTDSQTAALWVRLANSGGFLGLYIFSQGQWRPILPVNSDTTVQIFWFSSDSGTVPAGFTKIVGGDAVVPAPVVTALTAQYVTVGALDKYFAARFSGF